MVTCYRCGIATSNPKFCSKSCAASFNNSGRKRTKESKEKTSQTMKKLLKEGKVKPLPIGNQKGKTWRKEPSKNWIEYKQSCAFYTPYYILEQIENFEIIKNIGWYHPQNNPNGASRDHIFSIKHGWDLKIPPEIIRHPANCKIISMTENKRKGRTSHITIKELLKRIEDWNQRNS